MQIEKAIEVNEDNRVFFKMDGFIECAEAVQLGIEALKGFQCGREGLRTEFQTLLPGETED